MKSISLWMLICCLSYAQSGVANPAKPLRGGALNRSARAGGPEVPPYKLLKFPPLREVKIPDVATFTLPNGIRLYLVENHELPLISGFALIRTGNLFDPPDKVGLAEITGMVLRTGGTQSKTGDQLDEELENVAASVESSIGETSGRVNFSCLKENAAQVLAIFRDILTQPEFRQEKIDLAKTQLRGSIARRNDNAHGIASRELDSILYGRDTPYGWQMEYEHLDRIQRSDLQAFYRRYFFPSNIMIAAQGDFNTQEMKALLEKLFSSWDAKQEPVPPFPPVTAKSAPGVYLGVKTDVTQTFFAFGHLNGTFRDPDYPALEVMADILGGSFSSRLFRKVRTELGYAYSIYARWGAAYDHPGVFSVSGSTKSASTVETLRAALAEVERIRSSEVTDQELETAKQAVLNSFVFNFDHPSKTLSRIVTYEYYGYPRDFIFQYQKAVERVTKADILRVARQHLKPEALAIVAVGNPAEFGKPLSELGPVKEIDLRIPEPKRAAPAPSDAGSEERGKALLRKAQAAMGGAERLAAIHDVSSESEVEVYAGPSPIKVRQQTLYVAPHHMRSIQELPFGTLTMYSDTRTGWMRGPQGDMPVPEVLLRQTALQLFRLPYLLVLSERQPGRKITATGASTTLVSDDSGRSVEVRFDENGLTREMKYQTMTQSGPAEAVELLDEWKAVDGIQFPHRITVEQGGRKFADIRVTSIAVNQGKTVEDASQKP
jgi:zinc protease